MLALYFIIAGLYLYYSKSKYFPLFLQKLSFPGLDIVALLLLMIGTAIYIISGGWAGGLLLSLAACMLGFLLIQLFAVLGKKYFYGLVAAVHFLALIELISYAG